jgi:hypothetical protein
MNKTILSIVTIIAAVAIVGTLGITASVNRCVNDWLLINVN